MPNRDGSESRKNQMHGIRLKPKCHGKNRQSATKPRTEESSTTIPPEGSTLQAIGSGYGQAQTGKAVGQDIVCAHVKA